MAERRPIYEEPIYEESTYTLADGKGGADG